MTRTARYLATLAALAIAAFASVPSIAQTPSTVPPYNTDTGALITNSLRVAGTVNSAAQTNLDKSGAVCTFFQTAVSGSPSTTFSIQGYDAASASWNTLVTSSAITTSTTNINTIWVQPGLIAADVPSNGVGKSLHLPRSWRVSQTVGGTSTPATTGHVGCNLFK